MNAIVVVLGLAVATVSCSPIGSDLKTTPQGLVFMGATQNKELYISEPDITADFMRSLVVECRLRFQMSLVSVETPEEVSIIDNYFNVTEGNSSRPAWTSGVDRIGSIPAYWATKGEPVGVFPADIEGPWPSGAGSSPTYANLNCVSIQKVCVRPRGAPPGCFPSITRFGYNVCNENMRYICEKRISS